LKTEGTPVIVSAMPPGGTFDMRTLVTSYCEPERTILQAVSHFYNLPMFSIAGATEAKTVDSQAAAEAAMSLVVETLAGGNIIHDMGYMESGLTYSFVQLALCDEIVSWIKGFLKNYEVNDETLALDVIADAGPEGQYLKTKHTLKHYKERWYPNFFERLNYATWHDKGGKNFSKRTSENIETILNEHKPEPLQPEVKKRLNEIVRKAETQ
jgi:trimethylamine--corrinoid protein Co-methyltransferase